MNQFPILKIELEGIRQTMMHAFNGYTDTLNSAVRERLDKIVNDKYFTQMIATQVRQTLEESVQEALKSYFKYGKGREAIDATIQHALGLEKK